MTSNLLSGSPFIESVLIWAPIYLVRPVTFTRSHALLKEYAKTARYLADAADADRSVASEQAEDSCEVNRIIVPSKQTNSMFFKPSTKRKENMLGYRPSSTMHG